MLKNKLSISILREKLYGKLSSLRLPNGLFIASIGAHYKKVWQRDTFYESLPYLATEPEKFIQSMQSLLDFYIYNEVKKQKFYWIEKEPNNKASYRYTHPRMTPNLEEIDEPWGYKQNDCIGEVLYGIYLGESMGYKIIRNPIDKLIIEKMIKCLEVIEYWHDADNGLWEEYEEVHASSIGACVAGLQGIRQVGFEVPQWLIDKGLEALDNLLPRESVTKDCDLALMTLIYPFNVVNASMGLEILKNVEDKLLRERGVIRYKADVYYNTTNQRDAIANDRYFDPALPPCIREGEWWWNTENAVGHEAEWCFGIAYLALAYNSLGESEKAEYYLNMLLERCVDEEGNVPELFYSNTNISNDNTPLGWSVAMTILGIKTILGE